MDGDWPAQQFEDNRGHLRAVAFRMLGSAAEADDAVQEGWRCWSCWKSSHRPRVGFVLHDIFAVPFEDIAPGASSRPPRPGFEPGTLPVNSLM